MRVLLLVALGIAAMAVPARAATVSSSVSPGGCIKAYCEPPVEYVVFKAAPGERNDTRVTRDGTGLRFRDDGATVEAGSGCTAVDPHEARCDGPAQGVSLSLSADLGDADDRLGSDSVPITVSAGDGADVVTASGDAAVMISGGAGPDTLRGGAGADRLQGDSGADTLMGGDGDDTLLGDATDANLFGPGSDAGGPSDDTIDGGSGSDKVVYGRRTLVTVDLRIGAGGQNGEHDTLTSIEGVQGGVEDDVFFGDDGPNALSGGNGTDVLSGGGGDDTLESYGDARLYGDDGDDFLRPYNAARLSCGAGTDRVQLLVALPLGPDCELFVSQAGFGLTETQTTPVALTARRAVIRVACAPHPFGDRCSQPVIVQTADRFATRVCRRVKTHRRCTTKQLRVTIGRRDSGVIPVGQSHDVVVPFTRAGRRFRAQHRFARLRILVTEPSPGFGWILPS